jgi:AcrR family transcriptional regulator
MIDRVDNRHWRQVDTPSRKRAGGDARERLLDGLTRIAGSGEDFARVSVADVIAAAGASRSTFYDTFPDLESCVLAALEASGERLTGEVELALMMAPPPDPARAAVQALVRFAETQPEAARLLLVESLGAGTRALAVRDGLIDRLAASVETTRTQCEGGSALDVPALALLSGVFRLLSMRLPRGEAALHGLAGDLHAWADSYTRDSPPFQWHEGGPLGRIELRAPPEPRQIAPAGALPRGRHKLSPTEIARHQRERIVQALARESYERGYTAVTVTDVVKRAGISRNVFYEQFADKQQAAIAALRQTFEHAMGATASSFFAGEDWPERIWQMGGALTDHYYAHPVEAHLSFVELHAIGGEGIALAHERLNAFTLLLEEGYRHRSDDAPLPRTTSEALVATVLELGYRQAPRLEGERYPILLPQQTYMCLAPFLGAPRATELVQGWIESQPAQP